MGRATLILSSQSERKKACDWVMRAPHGTRLEFKATKRTLPQNARFYAMLSQIASQCEWHGLKLSVQDWKILFLSALKMELRMVPNLDGNGIVSLGRSSSDLSKSEMSDSMELISAWAANKVVVFKWEEKTDDNR